jgi:Family of unknown function (DUF5995)
MPRVTFVAMAISTAGVSTPYGPVTSIAGVLERMRAQATSFAPDDGLRHFNSLCLTVTEAIQGRMHEHSFEGPEFLERLDVVFANLYFAACDAAVAGQECAEAWEPLVERRHRRGISPLQFALAGMNAHINNDLPIALFTTCDEFGTRPEEDTPHCRDFRVVNAILRDVEHEAKLAFMKGALAWIDDAAGEVDDMLAMWSIYAARRVAWEQAQILWRLDRLGDFNGGYAKMLGRTVAMASRAFFV